jgi:hypothetical protein
MPILGIIASSMASFSPLSLPNLKAWYDAADTSSITGGSAVSQWNDKSGNGYHLTQSTSTKRPSSGTRSLNSKNVVDFDGTNDVLAASTASDWTFLNNSGASTAFYVLVQDTATTSQGYADTGGFSSATVDFEIYRAPTSTNLIHRVGNANTGAGPVENDTGTAVSAASHYFHLISDPSNATAANRSIFTLDGTALAKNNSRTTTPSSSAPNRALTIGGRTDDDGYAFNGAFAEIIFVSGIMSGANITKTTDYLKAKWGL